ncbi:hypothetical protein GcC1_035033, partial [Golovinomyces cichoracearum]
LRLKPLSPPKTRSQISSTHQICAEARLRCQTELGCTNTKAAHVTLYSNNTPTTPEARSSTTSMISIISQTSTLPRNPTLKSSVLSKARSSTTSLLQQAPTEISDNEMEHNNTQLSSS